MKVAALDIGDVWTGIAISDPLRIIAKPFTTAKTTELNKTLTSLISQESVTTIIVGLPRTMKGTDSAQTEKVRAFFKELEIQFPEVQWQLWDERLSTKRAHQIKVPKNKDEKTKSHAIAAAFILESYLSFTS